jgi:hypothetical protein
MKVPGKRTEWSRFTELFNTTYTGRETRLAVFERQNEVTNDYWIENGLPLVGVDVETHCGARNVRIRVGELSHSVPNAIKISFTFATADGEDGLDIVDADGRTTVLRLEKPA